MPIKEHKSWCNAYNDVPPFKCNCDPIHGPESGCPVEDCPECDKISKAITD